MPLSFVFVTSLNASDQCKKYEAYVQQLDKERRLNMQDREKASALRYQNDDLSEILLRREELERSILEKDKNTYEK